MFLLIQEYKKIDYLRIYIFKYYEYLKMSCLMFTVDKMCKNTQIDGSVFCKEHDCKYIHSDTCNICLNEQISNSENKLIFVKCGHSFHKECISEWLLRKNTCPCCREILKPVLNENVNENEATNVGTIILTGRFIEWFYDMAQTYVHDFTNVSLMDMLFVVNQENNYYYFYQTYINDRDYVSIDLFELELKLNEIANYARTNTSDIDNNTDNDTDDDIEINFV